MPTGQTQRRFGAREKALEPRSIKDIRDMLNPATRGTKIRNHKTIAGVMFFEIDCVRLVGRTGRMAYFRHCLVAGEDPHEEGCLAAMYLTDGARVLWTTHMRDVNDTRGGIPEVAWSTQPSGTCAGTIAKSFLVSLTILDLSTTRTGRIFGHQHLLHDGGFQHRLGIADIKPDNNNDQDDDLDPDFGDDFLSDSHHGGHRDATDHPHRLGSRFDNGGETHSGDEQQNSMSVDEDTEMDHDIANADRNQSNYYNNRSPSPRFVPHSRDNSPEITTRRVHDTTDDDDLEMNMNPANNDFELDDDIIIYPQPLKQPKLEPKVEPSSEVTITNGNTGFRNMNNFIDLTGEPDTVDEPMRAGSRSMQVIDLTHIKDLVVKRHSSGIDLIELED